MFKGVLNKFFSSKGKELEPLDFSSLVADMHSHLIPSIDDGSKSMEDSLALIRKFSQLGYKKLITTPHIMSDFYKNTPQIILSGLKEVQKKVAEEKIPVEIQAAAEYYVDEEFENKLDRNELLAFGKNYVLIELSYVYPPANIQQVIMKLIMAGYTPVLAHPERYPYWAGKFEEFQKLRDSGVLFQININSLNGHYSALACKMAHKLIDMNIYEFVGTDTHRMQHLDLVEQTKTDPYLQKMFSSGRLLNNTL